MEVHDRADDEKAVAQDLADKLQHWVEQNLAGQRTDPIFEENGAWNCWLAKGQEQ